MNDSHEVDHLSGSGHLGRWPTLAAPALVATFLSRPARGELRGFTMSADQRRYGDGDQQCATVEYI